MRKLLLVAAFALLNMSAAQADEGYLQQLDVFYGDLNLKSHSGAQVALRRIKHAAVNVCGGQPDSMLDLVAYGYFRDCVMDTTDGAVKRLNAPLVTSLFMSLPEDQRYALN